MKYIVSSQRQNIYQSFSSNGSSPRYLSNIQIGINTLGPIFHRQLGGTDAIDTITHTDDGIEFIHNHYSFYLTIPFLSNCFHFGNSCLFFEFFALILLWHKRLNLFIGSNTPTCDKSTKKRSIQQENIGEI